MYRTKLLSLSKISLLGILLISLLFLTFSSPLTAQAQTGSIKGNIKDKISGEPVIGANVSIQGGSVGSSTDIDGNFLINKVQEGTYTLAITSIGYKPATIPDVKVESGKVSVIATFIEEDVKGLEAVVVTAERETNTVVSLIREIKLAEQVAVGVSAEQISRTQDRDAAQVIRRVPGVSLIDNRFVMVRGLSQRYNAVMLNDIITPSSEVDIKSFSFDLIPSSIIDRMLIFKSGAGELPGEFAGGIIKIYTKDAPEENFTNFSLNFGHRIGTTFMNHEKIKGGSSDFLGFDNGDRAIPNGFPSARYNDELPFNQLSTTERANLANKMPNNWKTESVNINPDMRFSFALGRKFNIKKIEMGTLNSLNYSNTNQYADVDLNGYSYGNQTIQDFKYDDRQMTNNVRIGLLSNWFLRLNAKNRIEFKNLFNQMTFAETTLRDGQDITSTSNNVRSYSYRYETRSIYTGQLIGKHELSEKTNFNWVVGTAYTNRQEPDWRRLKTNKAIGTGENVLYSAEVGNDPNPQNAGRFYSNLNETIFTLTANVEHKFGKYETEETAKKLRFGFYTERKDRTFEARFFGYQRVFGSRANLSLPTNEVFAPSNVTGNQGFLTMVEGTQPNDKYTASNTLAAAYVSAFLPINKDLSISLGFRGEFNNQEISSRLRTFDLVKRSNPVFSPLPSVNISYDISDKSLLRLAYSMSVNRPEFRELAPFDFFDFPFNANVIGNSNLKTATIQNIDARWELYPSPEELISIGVFYKNFQNPIENFLLFTSNLGSLSYSFVNSKSAISGGAEIEIRKSLGAITSNSFLQNLSIVTNASIIFTKIDLGTTVELPDPSGAVSRVDVASIQDQNRPMMNQSPYLINAGVYYNSENSGWQFSVLYNVYGTRLFAVGNPIVPSVYEMPRNVIDLAFTKRLTKKVEIRGGIQDILNQAVQLRQDADRNGKIDGNDPTVRSFRRGSVINLGLSYNF